MKGPPWLNAKTFIILISPPPGPGTGVPFHFHGPGFAETLWVARNFYFTVTIVLQVCSQNVFFKTYFCFSHTPLKNGNGTLLTRWSCLIYCLLPRWGRKRWFMYPPDVNPSFHPNRTTLQWLLQDYPDQKDKPAFTECTLGPGEVSKM